MCSVAARFIGSGAGAAGHRKVQCAGTAGPVLTGAALSRADSVRRTVLDTLFFIASRISATCNVLGSCGACRGGAYGGVLGVLLGGDDNQRRLSARVTAANNGLCSIPLARLLVERAAGLQMQRRVWQRIDQRLRRSRARTYAHSIRTRCARIRMSDLPEMSM